jgi:hypothetical protein
VVIYFTGITLRHVTFKRASVPVDVLWYNMLDLSWREDNLTLRRCLYKCASIDECVSVNYRIFNNANETGMETICLPLRQTDNIHMSHAPLPDDIAFYVTNRTTTLKMYERILTINIA